MAYREDLAQTLWHKTKPKISIKFLLKRIVFKNNIFKKHTTRSSNCWGNNFQYVKAVLEN